MTVIEGSGLEELVTGVAGQMPRAMTILEAGCGRYRHWNYPHGSEIAGLDISEEQLEQNDHVDEKFLGDIQTWETARQWDVVVSVYVLEHVADPRRSVNNMLSWTRPGGLLVLAVPNALSLKGLVTKMTPFGFHAWFYRNIYRRPHAIFPTVMDWSITPANLRRQLSGHEVVIEHYCGEQLSPLFDRPYRMVCAVLRLLSFSRWTPGNSNYLLVVRKSGSGTSADNATSIPA